jgi:tetratricopeptide (TPR) repeat protein
MRSYITTCFLFLSVSLYSQECYLGKEHPKPNLSEEAYRDHTAKYVAALKNYSKDSSHADNIIWLGRRHAYLGRYQDAIQVFSKGILIHPADARFYRHRGHRYITLRCFDKAIEDLEMAASLIKGKEDEVEPDGIPNKENIPLSTLQTNIWYHLGLAYFLKGDLENAERAYAQGISISKNEDMHVAMANWLYISLLSRGNTDMAQIVFETVSQSPKLIENGDYLTNLYYYVHRPAVNEIERYTNTVVGKDTATVKAATIYFGAGYYARLNNMKEKADLLFKKALATGQWSSFGYIAAEAELKRMVK